MRRLLLAMVLASPALHATSMTFVSCTEGTITQTSTGTTSSSCQVGPFGSGFSADATAFDGITGAQGEVGTRIDAAGERGVVGSAEARASDSITYATTGPDRSGFIQFDIVLGYLHNDNAGTAVVLMSDGVHQYHYIGGGGIDGSTPPLHCEEESCHYAATLPFDLGSTFDISTSAHGTWSGPIPGFIGGIEGGTTVSFTLFEANGTTPVLFFVTPEPSTFGLLLLGSAAGAWFLLKRRSHQ